MGTMVQVLDGGRPKDSKNTCLTKRDGNVFSQIGPDMVTEFDNHHWMESSAYLSSLWWFAPSLPWGLGLRWRRATGWGCWSGWLWFWLWRLPYSPDSWLPFSCLWPGTASPTDRCSDGSRRGHTGQESEAEKIQSQLNGILSQIKFASKSSTIGKQKKSRNSKLHTLDSKKSHP